MRTWSRRSLLLGGVGCLLMACTQGQAGKAGYSIMVSGEGTQVTIVQNHSLDIEEGAYIVNIQSTQGIGQANIAWWGDASPHPLYFQLHLSGLEQFTLRWADLAVNVSVNSTDQTVYQGYQRGRESETMIRTDSPYWMDIAIPQVAGDVFLLKAPAAFVATGPRLWSVAWVDFYR